MCLDKAKTATPLSERVFIQGHLDNLIGSWWEREARVSQATPAAENTKEMGERYDGNGCGGNYGREGGGPSRQHQFGGYRGNNFQRPPFSRPRNFGVTSTRTTSGLEEGMGSSIIKAEGNMDRTHGSSTTIRVREGEMVIENNMRTGQSLCA
jgi:hypothetical protein